jgi:type II secretory pathway component GspD/PulD (secretin)
MIRMGFCSAVLSLLCVSSGLRAEEPPAAGKVVQLEIVLATASVPSEEAAAAERPAGKEALAQIEAWSKAGKLTHLTRIKVHTLEQSAAEFQFSEVVPLITGRTVFPGGRGGNPMVQQPTFTREEAGTLISATPRVEESGTILVFLKVEQSRFETQPAQPQSEGEKDFPLPPSKEMQTCQTTVRIKDGVPEVVGGFTSSTIDGTTQSVVVLTAHVQKP